MRILNHFLSVNVRSQHAFDSAGRLYNQEGKLQEWWTNSTSEGFRRIQDCIVDQYSCEYRMKV